MMVADDGFRQVVETLVNTNNSPSQDYTTNPDDLSNHITIVLEINKYVNLFSTFIVLYLTFSNDYSGPAEPVRTF